MASTIQLSRTVTLASQMIRNAPLVFAAQNNDPALSNADWVKQMILSPPFAWRWNRASSVPSSPTFTTTIGTTDYTVPLSDFGWIEKAVAYDPSNGYQAFELVTDLVQGQETQANQLTRIAAQLDDDNGNITFRVMPAPDAAYDVCVTYQKSASLFTATTQTWTPIPDYLSYLYNLGFQAKAYEYWDDPRWVPTMQMFLTQLVAASENLTDTEKNIWLEDRLRTLRQTERAQNLPPR